MTTSTPLWRGVGVALATLFSATPSGAVEVDVEATAAHAARLVSLGVRAVLVAGSTGEAAALDDQEREAMIAAVRRACPGLPVLAGTSASCAGSAIARTAAAVACGADAVLVAPPWHCADLSGFYARVGKAADPAPVLAYHYPPLAGDAIPVDALSDLAVAGIKDSSGDPERLLAQLDGWTGWVYVGSAVLTGFAGALGATGAILAVANVAVEESLAAWSGDAAAQRRLLTAHRGARAHFPLGLKRMMAQRFATSTASRMG